MKVEIYDPAMCCSSGLCGPAIETQLIVANLVLPEQACSNVFFGIGGGCNWNT